MARVRMRSGATHTVSSGGGDIHDILRQMLAVLESERQALAGLDLDAIMEATASKGQLCGFLDHCGTVALDEECLGMLDAARRLNDVNRQVRNIIAANVSRRLSALTGSPQLYRIGPGYAQSGARG